VLCAERSFKRLHVQSDFVGKMNDNTPRGYLLIKGKLGCYTN